MFFINTMIGQGTLTKISLFRQTTAFDSIVAKKDSLYFYNQDSVHRAYLPFAVDSIKQKGLDSLIIFQGKDFAIYPFAVLDNYFTEIQAGHGFSIPSWGVLPLFYNFTTSRYDLASIDSIGKACDILVVDLPDGNTIGIQNTGYIELNHALDVGYWWYLNSIAGQIVREDAIIDSSKNENLVQRLFFTATNTTILLQPEEPKVILFDICTGVVRAFDWNEDFDGLLNNATNDNGATAWTSMISSGSGRVSSRTTTNKFEWNNAYGEWLSEAIDISCFTGDVEIYVDYEEAGDLDNPDTFDIEYRIDGGAWVSLFSDINDFAQPTNLTVTVPVNNNQSIQVRAFGGTDNTNETIRLESVRVRTL